MNGNHANVKMRQREEKALPIECFAEGFRTMNE